MMEEEILSIDSKTKTIKALGIEVDAKLEQIKILVNGKDIAKNLKIENLKIIKEIKKEVKEIKKEEVE